MAHHHARYVGDALDNRLKLFGSQVVADMIRHSLETMDAPSIAAAYKDAATDFEREAIGIHGRSLLQMRASTSPTGETLLALEALNQAEPKELQSAHTELGDIDHSLTHLDKLDREACNNMLADRMGVNAAFIDADA